MDPNENQPPAAPAAGDLQAPDAAAAAPEKTADSAGADVFASLSDEERAFASEHKITNAGEAVRMARIFQSQSKLPGDRVLELPIEGDEKASEKLAAIYGKLGRPDAPDAYKMPALEMFKLDEREAPEVMKGLHDLNLTQSQFEGVMAMLDGRVKAAAAAQDADAAKHVETAEQQLRQEWGGAYDERLRVAASLAQSRGEGFMAMLDETGLGNNPEVAKLLYDFAKATQEPGALEGMARADFGKPSAEEAAAKLRDFDQRHAAALQDRKHPDHTALTKERLELIKQAGPLASRTAA